MLFTARQCQLLVPSVIINKFTRLSRLLLYFDIYACFICLILYVTYSIFKAIVLLFCSSFLQSFECEGNSMSFQILLLIKGLRLEILSGWWLIFWWFSAAAIAYWKHLWSLVFLGFIVTPLFFIHSRDLIYELLLFKLILWTCYYSKSIRSNIKLLRFIFVSNPSWYLLRKVSKSSLIASSVSIPLMIVVLSLFVCITRVSFESMKQTKMIRIMCCIFHLL